MSNITKVAKQLAEANSKLPKAYKYDLVLRDFDNKVELIGLVDDPTYDIADFRGREMLFPKKWVTLDVYEPTTEVVV
ncbi:MAG: hypothetical protein ACO3B0_08990 [Chitinophagaceae bacterium]